MGRLSESQDAAHGDESVAQGTTKLSPSRDAASVEAWLDHLIGSEEEREYADAILAVIAAAGELADQPFGSLNERSFYRLREALDGLA